MVLKHTNWIVLAGVSCSGKTTTCRLLQEKGYGYIGDIEGLLTEAGARNRIDFFADDLNFRKEVLKVSIRKEFQALEGQASNPLILESCAFSRSHAFKRLGGNPEIIEPELPRAIYRLVFILDRLPFVANGIRPFRKDEYLDKMEQSIEMEFISAGYDAIRVPVLAPVKRAGLIINRILKNDN